MCRSIIFRNRSDALAWGDAYAWGVIVHEDMLGHSMKLSHGMLGQGGEMLELRSPWDLGEYLGLVRDYASAWGCLCMTEDSHAE